MRNGLHTTTLGEINRGQSAVNRSNGGKTRKVLLCIWWDWKGITYYELLPNGQTLNSNPYCQQLSRLKPAINQKYPELANRRSFVFHQNSTMAYTSTETH
ncbi:mariner transposase [Trichonephila clavipes]|nr:mariner transposase [Trichonephila clavipes]